MRKLYSLLITVAVIGLVSAANAQGGLSGLSKSSPAEQKNKGPLIHKCLLLGGALGLGYLVTYSHHSLNLS
jgi:hypothetical protein